MKKLLLTICILLLLSGIVFATPNFAVQNNSPLTEYKKILFVPRAQLDGGLGSTCSPVGTIYVNKDTGSLPFFCLNNGASNTWSLLSGVWKQSGNIISLKDTLTPSAKKIGIGTTSPQLKLSLDNDGGIFAQGTYNPADSSLTSLPSTLSKGLYFIWYPKKAAFWAGEFNAGSFSTYGPQDSQIGDFSVSLGSNNLASATGSGVLSGNLNRILSGADYSVIVSGQSNTINSNSLYNIIAAGSSNQITGNHGFIGGCQNCDLTGDFLTVLSGLNNDIDSLSSHSFIGSGQNNTIHGFNDSMGETVDNANVIGSGNINTIYGGYNVIATGGSNIIGQSTDNTAPIAYSYIGAGADNKVYSSYSTIGGGYFNSCLTTASHKTIAGGTYNFVSGQYSTIAGGDHNTIESGSKNTIAGGSQNTIGTGSQLAFISGFFNSIRGNTNYSGILGGSDNSENAGWNAIHGGRRITTTTNDHYYTVTGGEEVTTNGIASWVIGTNLNFPSVLNYGFFWGHYADLTNPIPSVSNYNFIIATGKVGIGTLSPSEKLHVNGDMRISNGTLSITALPDATGSSLNRDNITGTIGLDLAERFSSSESVEPGDVVVIGTDSLLLKSTAAHDKHVIGIVSHTPGALLDGTQLQFSPGGIAFEGGDYPPIALAGRVSIKVTLENGPIEAGDFLTSSSLPGHAMRAEHSNDATHTIVAKALEHFDGGTEGQNTGIIQAIVTLR